MEDPDIWSVKKLVMVVLVVVLVIAASQLVAS